MHQRIRSRIGYSYFTLKCFHFPEKISNWSEVSSNQTEYSDAKTGCYRVMNQLQIAPMNYSTQQLAFTRSYRTFYYNDSCLALSNHFLKSFHAEDIRSLNCSAQKIPYHEKRNYQALQV
jgi:hypothetical protein